LLNAEVDEVSTTIEKSKKKKKEVVTQLKEADILKGYKYLPF